ncbi:MAG: glycosyltransferase family 39 protein [Blastocatellia bacterium]
MNSSNDLEFGLVLLILLGAMGFFLVAATERHRETIRFQRRLFLTALFARFIFSILIYQTDLVRMLGDEDSSGWYAGVGLMRQWTQKGVSILDLPQVLSGAFEGHHRGYGYLTGLLFYLTGAAGRLPAAVLNCFFGAVTVVFAYRIARTLFPERVAYWTGWMTCLAPTLIIWSSQTVKEPVVIMIEVIALYGCVQLKRGGFSIRYLALCGLAIILVLPFRFYAAYIVGAAVLLSLFLPQLGRRKMTLWSGLGVAALVIPLVLSTGILAQYEREIQQFDVERISTFRKNVSTGSMGTGSGVSTDYDMNTATGFGLATLTGSAYFLLAPFPWQLGGGSARMLLTTPEVFAWWFLFFFGVLPGLWWLLRHRFSDIQPLLFFTFGLGLLYSMMFGNVGLAYRQRAQLLPFLLIFASVGLELRRQRREAARQARRTLRQPVPLRVPN